MVLPVRIELTTSALPRMRSTTELRQHVVRKAAPMAKPPCDVNPCEPWQVMAGQSNDREERLAAALRENLRKRKAQARDQQSKKEQPSD